MMRSERKRWSVNCGQMRKNVDIHHHFQCHRRHIALDHFRYFEPETQSMRHMMQWTEVPFPAIGNQSDSITDDPRKGDAARHRAIIRNLSANEIPE